MFCLILGEQTVSSSPLYPPPLLRPRSSSSLSCSGKTNLSFSARTMMPLSSSLACNLLINWGSILKASAKSSSSKPLNMLRLCCCSSSPLLLPPCSLLSPRSPWLSAACGFPARKNFCFFFHVNMLLVNNI